MVTVSHLLDHPVFHLCSNPLPVCTGCNLSCYIRVHFKTAFLAKHMWGCWSLFLKEYTPIWWNSPGVWEEDEIILQSSELHSCKGTDHSGTCQLVMVRVHPAHSRFRMKPDNRHLFAYWVGILSPRLLSWNQSRNQQFLFATTWLAKFSDLQIKDKVI